MVKQESLFDSAAWLCADPAKADTYGKRIEVAARFCAERHKVYIKKETEKQDRPWTKDWILQSSRFCNIYRELDRVTVDIMDRWIKPNLDNPNIGLVAIFGRVINLPSTLDLLMDAGFDFRKKPNNERMFALFNKVKGQKRALVTGAYIVNTVFPKDFPKQDGSKADYIANFLAPALWENRKDIAESLASGSFRETLDAMKRVHGIGTFIGNQAAVDLSYTKLLSKAPDIDTTWNPGPGTTKGIRWITQDKTLTAGSKAMDEALTAYRNDLNYALSRHKLFADNAKKMRTHIVPLSGPNASNSLCELSKFVAVALGERKRLKQKYQGI
jgi:hypothetical protein